jgi:hypothetical protein
MTVTFYADICPNIVVECVAFLLLILNFSGSSTVQDIAMVTDICRRVSSVRPGGWDITPKKTTTAFFTSFQIHSSLVILTLDVV